MEISLFSPRANVPVSGAPSGLVSWCTVGTDPSGVLVKPAGTIAHHHNRVQFWLNLNGTAAGWIAGHLLSAAAWAALLDIAASYAAGWRPGAIVHSAAFNAASVTVAGLSAANRYIFQLQTNDNGVDEGFLVEPDGASANCESIFQLRDGTLSDGAFLVCGNHQNGGAARVSVGELSPRTGGISALIASTAPTAAPPPTALWKAVGSTTTDFTSLEFVVAAGLRTGWLTLIEMAP